MLVGIASEVDGNKDGQRSGCVWSQTANNYQLSQSIIVQQTTTKTITPPTQLIHRSAPNPHWMNANLMNFHSLLCLRHKWDENRPLIPKLVYRSTEHRISVPEF